MLNNTNARFLAKGWLLNYVLSDPKQISDCIVNNDANFILIFPVKIKHKICKNMNSVQQQREHHH